MTLYWLLDDKGRPRPRGASPYLGRDFIIDRTNAFTEGQRCLLGGKTVYIGNSFTLEEAPKVTKELIEHILRVEKQGLNLSGLPFHCAEA